MKKCKFFKILNKHQILLINLKIYTSFGKDRVLIIKLVFSYVLAFKKVCVKDL